MGQIMQRLLDGVQVELQAQERDLCAHLNTLASKKVTAVKESRQQEYGSSSTLHSSSSAVHGSSSTLQSPGAGQGQSADKSGSSTGQKRKRKSDTGKTVQVSVDFSEQCVAVFNLLHVSKASNVQLV